ncbi:putative phospholipid hydroperoxide glutathione peroxidase 6 [Diplonema papillatum]|nr:putative phospholipid hydroperoxide glutathione peroxidase 6 [Diplonema papillatum]
MRAMRPMLLVGRAQAAPRWTTGVSSFVRAARFVSQSAYDFQAKTIDGDVVELSKYKGKPLIVVNVASQCGFTDSGYKSLVALQEKYNGKFEVLAFPCNQFGGQEPGTSSEICSLAQERYKFKGKLMDKVDVNGDAAHPLWKWMKEQASGVFGTNSVKWNFTKFLIDKNGHVVRRYSAIDSAESLEKDLAALL